MRRIRSSGSLKAFSLDKNELMKKLREEAAEAVLLFPEIKEIRLVGSVARGDHTGLSDVDLFIVTESGEKNPLDRMKPYYRFFSGKIGLSLDIITALKQETEAYKDLLRDSILLS